MSVPHTSASSANGSTARVGFALLMGASLVLAGCTSAAPDPARAAPTSEVATQYAAYTALSVGEQETLLRNVTSDLERRLVTLSGLEAELGGAAAADAQFAAVSTALVKRGEALRASPPTFKRFGAPGRATADEISLGGLIFGNWMITALATGAAVSSTNDAKPGERATDTQKSSDSTITREGSLESASIDWSTEVTIKGVTGKMKTKIVINPCPDAQGNFSATVSMTSSATTGGGRVGSSSIVDISIEGRVNDDAQVAGYDTVTRSQAAEFGGGKKSYADVTDRGSREGGTLTGYTRTVNRSVGDGTDFASQWANMGMLTEAMATTSVLRSAQQGWESGRCVALVPTTAPTKRTALKPSTSFTITAPPRSKVDGSKVGGTVTAALTGASSITPAGKVPADATFTYVAPDEKDKRASVVLEARSKRGVAKSTLDFDTYANTAWVIRETQGPYEFRGVSCKSEKGPWEITYRLVDQPGLTGTGAIRITFPGDRTTPDTAVVTGTGTERGELKAVGLPGGVRFRSAVNGTLSPMDEDSYDMTLKNTGGTATGYAGSQSKTLAWPGSGFALKVKASNGYSCS